eukprot:gene36927-44800_t
MPPPSAPTFTVRSALLLVFGILCGIFLPFIVRSWVARSESSPDLTNSSSLTGALPRESILSTTKRVPAARTKASVLQEEKNLLLKRLKEVERELETLVTKPDSFIQPKVTLSFDKGEENHTPTFSPSVKPTLRPTSAQAVARRHATVDTATTAAKSSNSCKYKFTVYVYPIPPTLTVISTSEEARRNRTLHVCKKCILEQFALEYIIYDFFTTYCNRVYDPQQADYFYLPLVRDAEFRLSMSLFAGKGRASSQAELALLDTLEKNDTTLWRNYFNITDEFWHRKQGRDHIIVMPAPVTNFRHETNQRGFFHY